MGKIADQLAQCTGTEDYYKHPLTNLQYTDGIKMLAEMAGCYWLVDLVGSYLQVIGLEFVVWDIRKTADGKFAVSAWLDTPYKSEQLVFQLIHYTDFPFDDLGEPFQWYQQNHTMFLKSEY